MALKFVFILLFIATIPLRRALIYQCSTPFSQVMTP
jgi:hypothetical protein